MSFSVFFDDAFAFSIFLFSVSSFVSMLFSVFKRLSMILSSAICVIFVVLVSVGVGIQGF